MSYILEALKKLEQKQERQEPQRSLTFFGAPERERKRRVLWPYLLVAGLFLNAALMVWWFGGWLPDEQAIAPPPSSATTHSPPPVQQPVAQAQGTNTQPVTSAAGREDVHREQMRTNDLKGSMGEDRQVKNTGAPATNVFRKGEQDSSPHDVTPSITARVVPEQHRRVEAKPQDRRILKLNELPRAVRNGLPEFRISGHAYSPEPQTRVARVNEKILQEGQELTPGLKLEEIIPSGLIFSYQGYRFRVTISENR
ncbi:MAG: hypothetical protein A4E57_01857 [Syntrophorhabdaceae bacterium PtaU1.Bin034]|nr:MAG: hypothetical protein A4E57_01857 [Syntrophorhabdaceae bacterium PtaU1.Bin034]